MADGYTDCLHSKASDQALCKEKLQEKGWCNLYSVFTGMPLTVFNTGTRPYK